MKWLINNGIETFNKSSEKIPAEKMLQVISKKRTPFEMEFEQEINEMLNPDKKPAAEE